MYSLLMIATVVFAADEAKKENDPRRELKSTIDYAKRLLEEKEYEKFLNWKESSK